MGQWMWVRLGVLGIRTNGHEALSYCICRAVA